ncbi:MAG: hypothetical protein IT463_00860 [Planctomycetes bacterium]|nr:hypothetical protein [Planctomycetota bacterium]
MTTPFGTMFNKGAAPVLERALSFAEQRHKLIAHNIANVETPHYKPVDLPAETFQDVLRRSMKARDAKPVRTFSLRPRGDVWETGPGTGSNLPAPYAGEDHGAEGVWEDQRSGLHFSVRRSDAQGVLRHGENRVDIDAEMARLAENGLQYRMVGTLLKKQYQLLRDTITERP